MLSLFAVTLSLIGQNPLSHTSPLTTIALPPGPGPIDNPLKGFASYSGKSDRHYGPVSMAFHYVPWSELEPNEGDYRFDAMESKYWQTSLARDKPIVFRVYLDYPGRPNGVPEWLIQRGIGMRPYRRSTAGQSPDYDDPNLRAHLVKLIAALGQRYNTNPRVAFIEVGFLGHWGEWHTFPQTELFANQETQTLVLNAMRNAFPDKQLMARYGDYASCRLPWLGFHDDLFPEDTLAGVSWHFPPRMVRGGTDRNWQVAPIGGEMVPRAAEKWLGEGWETTQQAVRDGHFSWIDPTTLLLSQHQTRTLLPEDYCSSRCWDTNSRGKPSPSRNHLASIGYLNSPWREETMVSPLSTILGASVSRCWGPTMIFNGNGNPTSTSEIGNRVRSPSTRKLS